MAFHIFDSMGSAQVAPNVISHGAVISACEKSGQWQWASHLLLGWNWVELGAIEMGPPAELA